MSAVLRARQNRSFVPGPIDHCTGPIARLGNQGRFSFPTPLANARSKSL
jgi:hypothetical protein